MAAADASTTSGSDSVSMKNQSKTYTIASRNLVTVKFVVVMLRLLFFDGRLFLQEETGFTW